MEENFIRETSDWGNEGVDLSKSFLYRDLFVFGHPELVLELKDFVINDSPQENVILLGGLPIECDFSGRRNMLRVAWRAGKSVNMMYLYKYRGLVR